MNFIKTALFIITTATYSINAFLTPYETTIGFSNQEVDMALIIHAGEQASIVAINTLDLFLRDPKNTSTKTKEVFYGKKAYEAAYKGASPEEFEWATPEEALNAAAARKDTSFILVGMPTSGYKYRKPSEQAKLIENVKNCLNLLKKTNKIKPVVIILQEEFNESFINSFIIDNAQVAGIISDSQEKFIPCREEAFELKKPETSSCSDDCSDFALNNCDWTNGTDAQEVPARRMIPHNGFAINMHGTPVVYGMNFVLWAKLLQKIGISVPSTVQEELANAADSFVMSPWHENYTKWSYLYNRLALLKCKDKQLGTWPFEMIPAETKAEYNL